AERAEVGVMRRLDAHRPALAHQAMELLHGANHVVDMLDYVNRRQPIERAVGERVRKAIEVGQNVGEARGIPVEPDRPGLLVNPAADVEDSHSRVVAAVRHSSRVSRAKSHWSRVTTSGGQRRIVLSPAPSTSTPRSNAMLTIR